MTEKEFDSLIKEAGILAIEEMEKDTLQHLKDKPIFEFSKKHEKQMKKIFKMVRDGKI